MVKMIDNGYIKLHRSLLRNPVVMKDSDHLAVWIYLLLQATFSGEVEVIFAGQRRKLRAGEFTTGRKKIAAELGISESKVQRILRTFEIEQQIEQQTDFKCRLISIVNWNKYQQNEQVNEQLVNRWRTGGEQLVNTKEERKECKEGNNVKECIDNQSDKKNMSSAMKRVIEYRKQIERIKQ